MPTVAAGICTAARAVRERTANSMRNVVARVLKGNSEMVAAVIRTVFAQPDAEHVRSQFDVVAGMLGRQFPPVEAMLRKAEADLLAFTAFPDRTRRS